MKLHTLALSEALLLSTVVSVLAGPPPYPLGAAQGNPSTWDATSQALFDTNFRSLSKLMKASPIFINSAVDYNQPVSSWRGSASEQARSNWASMNARSQIPVFGFPMFSVAVGSARPEVQMKAFAAGRYDSQIQGVVSAWTSQGFKRLYVRLGWEMNLPDTPTYVGDDAQSHAAFVLAFRHMYSVLHRAAQANGATINVIWNPSTTNYSNADAIHSLYPGDSYLDIVGVDVYADMAPYVDSTDPVTYHNWQTGGEETDLATWMANPVNRRHYWSHPAGNKWTNDGSGGHSQTFTSIIRFARLRNKPFAVCETGAGNSDHRTDINDDDVFPEWLAEQIKEQVVLGLKVVYIGLWNANSGGNYEFSNPYNNKPKEAAAWARAFGAVESELTAKRELK